MSSSSHHIVPLKTYVNVLGALLVLTVITVWVAQFDFGAMNTVIALAVATIKAGLVMAIFMGVKYDGTKTMAFMMFMFSVFFIVLLFAFSALDIYTRFFQQSTL